MSEIIWTSVGSIDDPLEGPVIVKSLKTGAVSFTFNEFFKLKVKDGNFSVFNITNPRGGVNNQRLNVLGGVNRNYADISIPYIKTPGSFEVDYELTDGTRGEVICYVAPAGEDKKAKVRRQLVGVTVMDELVVVSEPVKPAVTLAGRLKAIEEALYDVVTDVQQGIYG